MKLVVRHPEWKKKVEDFLFLPLGHLGKALKNVFLLDIVPNWANLGGKISCEDGFFGL